MRIAYKQTNTQTNSDFMTKKKEKSDGGDDSSDHRDARTSVAVFCRSDDTC